jgi:AraC family transcriptional regulator
LGRDFVGRVAAEAGVDPARTEIMDALNAHDAQAERILLSFLAEIETEGLGGELYAQALATQLAVHLLREHSSLGQRAKRGVAREPRGGLSRRALKKARDYVGDNLAGDLSLAEIARAANLSERHFSRLLKEATGLSPHQYVIRQRIEKAKDLLARTDLPIGEVALAAGFSHQGHLARHLVRLVGLTPARFRARARR